MSMFGSMSRVGYLRARGGALGAGSANAMRELGGSEKGEGAPSGVRGRGMVVARGSGGMIFARSPGAAVVGGMTGFKEGSEMGCWTGADAESDPDAAISGDEDVVPAPVMGIPVASGRIGATGAGPGTGGKKGCFGSVDRGEDDLQNVPVAFTSSNILLLFDMTDVGFCVVSVAASGAAFGVEVAFVL